MLFAVGLWDPLWDRSQATLLPEALPMVDKPRVKPLPVAQASDSTINLKGIFIVLRTGNLGAFVLMRSPDNLTQHFPCTLVLGKSHGCSFSQGYF